MGTGVTTGQPAVGRQSGRTLALAVAPVAAFPDASDRTWRRMLGADEVGYCTGLRRAGEHLAARALARRVVAEALGWDGDPWSDVAIRRDLSGRPSVVLGGELAAWQRRHRLPVPGLSLSHAAGYAGALAWLPATGPAERRTRSVRADRRPLVREEDGR
jgi:phosphopantetheinyl transferase (holo-ACP synthase)